MNSEALVEYKIVLTATLYKNINIKMDDMSQDGGYNSNK